jgi:hypothetical protein
MEEETNFEDDAEKALSKINSASIINITLNELFKDFFRHYRDGKFLSANNDLDCIWTVLGGEKGIEGTDVEIKYSNLDLKIKGLRDSLSTIGFTTINKDNISMFGVQKKALIDKALFLRRLLNNQGKGTAYHSADEDYMD